MDFGNRNVRPSQRFYELLLLLYPTDFRLRFGPDMIHAWRDAQSLAMNETLRKRLGFWLWTFEDLSRSLWDQWGTALREQSKIEGYAHAIVDLLSVPCAVTGILLMAEFMGATFVHHPSAPGAKNEGDHMKFMLATYVAVALGLGIASVFGAFFAGRSRRIANIGLKL